MTKNCGTWNRSLAWSDPSSPSRSPGSRPISHVPLRSEMIARLQISCFSRYSHGGLVAVHYNVFDVGEGPSAPTNFASLSIGQACAGAHGGVPEVITHLTINTGARQALMGCATTSITQPRLRPCIRQHVVLTDPNRDDLASTSYPPRSQINRLRYQLLFFQLLSMTRG